MSTASATSVCANCHAPTTGAYCSACGQAAHVGRLHLHDLGHEVWHALTHAHHGILRLSKDLLRRPRQTYLRYFAGQRRTYFSPVLYFLLSAGALAVLYPYVFAYEDHVSGVRNEFGRELYHLIKYRTLALLPVQVFLVWLGFRRSYNLSEVSVFWLFCLGFTFVARLVLLPLYFPFIKQKEILDTVFDGLSTGIILWNTLTVFAPRGWKGQAYVLVVVTGCNVLNYLLQGYLVYEQAFWQRPEASLGHLLRAMWLPN